MIKKNKQFQKIVLMAFILFSGSIMFSQNSEAAGSPISVKPILPENQQKNDNTYYDILMSPSQEQDLKLQIYNSSNKEEEVEVSINTALTSDGGNIDYSRKLSEDIRDQSMTYAMEELVSVVEPKIRIPANDTIFVNLHVKAPSKVIDGPLIGAVTVRYLSDEKQEQEGQMAVVNNVAFVNTIKLTMSDKKVEGDLLYQRAYAAQTAGRNQVNIMLQNPKQSLLNKLTYSAQIYKKNETSVLHEKQAKNYRVAPTTNFNFPISWEGEAFKAGDYQLKMKVQSEETGQEWKFSEEFSITAEEAKKLNESAVDVEPDYLIYYIIATAFGALVIFLLVFLIIKRSKQKQQQELERLRREKISKQRKRSKRRKSSKGKKE